MQQETVDVAAVRYRKLTEIDRDALKYVKFEHIEGALQRFAKYAGHTIDKKSVNYYLLLRSTLLMRIKALAVKE